MTANDPLARSGHTLLALRRSLETRQPAKRRKYPRTSQEGRSRQVRRLVQAPLSCVRALVRMALPLKGLRLRYKPSNTSVQSNANALLLGKVLASTDRRAYDLPRRRVRLRRVPSRRQERRVPRRICTSVSALRDIVIHGPDGLCAGPLHGPDGLRAGPLRRNVRHKSPAFSNPRPRFREKEN